MNVKSVDRENFPPRNSLLKSCSKCQVLLLLPYSRVLSCTYISLCIHVPFLHLNLLLPKTTQAEEETSFTKMSLTAQETLYNINVWWGCFLRFCTIPVIVLNGF